MSASGHSSGSDDKVELDFDFSDLPEENATPPAQVIEREDATSILDSKKLILKAAKLELLRNAFGEQRGFTDNVRAGSVELLNAAMPPRILITCADIVTVAAMAKALVAIAAVLKDGAGSRRNMTSAALAILQCVASGEALASTLNDKADGTRERARKKAEKNARDQKAGGQEQKPAFDETTYNICLKCQHDNLNVQMTDLQYAQECSRAQLVYDDNFNQTSGGNCPSCQANSAAGLQVDSAKCLVCNCYCTFFYKLGDIPKVALEIALQKKQQQEAGSSSSSSSGGGGSSSTITAPILSSPLLPARVERRSTSEQEQLEQATKEYLVEMQPYFDQGLFEVDYVEIQLGPPTSKVGGVEVRSLDVRGKGKSARNNRLYDERTAPSPASLRYDEDYNSAIAASLLSTPLVADLGTVPSINAISGSSSNYTVELSAYTADLSAFFGRDCVIAALVISGDEAEEQVRVLMTKDSQDSATALKIMVKSVMKSN
ncbi:hypothetical protein B484DRAFT_401731 [Ochromonadaceae sp. CCMP2298]|nr:hypothetical protein B484DRAFT_401731 [Ochromonadaceae sp. CCMP2298]